MNNFALLWGKILKSSLWVQESKETRLVWIALLASKDSNGLVHSSVVGLADDAKVSVPECREALRVLLSPDPDDTSKVEDGRRIREIPGGWEIINHDLYRFSTEAKREFWRQQKAEQRARVRLPVRPIKMVKKSARKKRVNGGKFPSGNSYQRASDAGASQEQLDALASEGLPEELN